MMDELARNARKKLEKYRREVEPIDSKELLSRLELMVILSKRLPYEDGEAHDLFVKIQQQQYLLLENAYKDVDIEAMKEKLSRGGE